MKKEQTIWPGWYKQPVTEIVIAILNSFFRAAKRCLCGYKLVSVSVSWILQRAANALTAGNLPDSIFSLTSSTKSHTGACASEGHEI